MGALFALAYFFAGIYVLLNLLFCAYHLLTGNTSAASVEFFHALLAVAGGWLFIILLRWLGAFPKWKL